MYTRFLGANDINVSLRNKILSEKYNSESNNRLKLLVINKYGSKIIILVRHIFGFHSARLDRFITIGSHGREPK